MNILIQVPPDHCLVACEPIFRALREGGYRLALDTQGQVVATHRSQPAEPPALNVIPLRRRAAPTGD